MTTTPFEPIDSPEPGPHVDDLTVSEDPDIETPTVPPEEDVTGDPGTAEPTD